MMKRKDLEMFKGLLKKGLITGFFVAFCTGGLIAQVNNDLFFKYCEIHPQKQCFDPVEGAIDSVGRDVTELGGGFQFCMKIDSVDGGFAPIRVVLVLDQSYSMCRNPDKRTGCCSPGDSTLNCMTNDPLDMRIKAAHAFVDSLAKKSPLSTVGIVAYDQTATRGRKPLPLNDVGNVQQIHTWIDSASCIAHNWPPITTSPVVASGGLSKTAKTKKTFLGDGMAAGLTVLDNDYPSIIGVPRHLIQLTDGAWDDDSLSATATPEAIINNYKTLYPDRPVPVIHGVFLSNVVLHEAHKYPREGCSNNEPVILGKLEQATKLTNGQYFSGSTPQTVVDNFATLLTKMTVRVKRQLTGMVVTNTTNGVVRTQKTISQADTSIKDTVIYYSTLDKLPLEYGHNKLMVQRIIKKSETAPPDTDTAFVNIFRSDKWSTSTLDSKDYETYCTKDSTTISITVSPPSLPIKSPFDVHSTIIMKKEFVLDSIEVRVFTQFPNTDQTTVSVYHLENDLKNSVDNLDAPVSTVGFSESNALFGTYALTNGAFETGIKSIPGDFAFEAWIRLPANVTQTNLFRGTDFSFGIGADRMLYFTGKDIAPVKAYMPVDANSWTHVAASRAAGKVTLFINGINVSESVQFTATLIGTATITCPAGGMLDEVRISSSSRQRPDPGKLRLDIPSLQNPVWTIGGQSSTQSMVILTPQMWNNGNIDFKFASPIMGKLVVNFQRKGTTETQWSKNGNAVFVAGDLQGPYVKNAIFTTGPLGGIYDTLQVFFTELVRCDSLRKSSQPAASFKIFGRNKALKDTVFKGAYYVENVCPETFIDKITIIVKASVDGIVPKVDSIQLVGSVVDTAGNGPDTTKLGPIAYGGDNNIVIVPYESPEPMKLPEGILRRIPEKERNNGIGKAIIIQTTRPLSYPPQKPGTFDSTWALKTIMYDVVANVIAVDLPLKQFPQNDRLYYVIWPGTNLNHRRVSSGAYLFRATVQLEGETQPKYLHTKLSIKWEDTK